jgi:hypothetical protein
MVRNGAVVAIDPDRGKVLAVSGVTSTQTLERALSTISFCGRGDAGGVLLLEMDAGAGGCPLSGSTSNGLNLG